jgi:hypothetical protein
MRTSYHGVHEPFALRSNTIFLHDWRYVSHAGNLAGGIEIAPFRPHAPGLPRPHPCRGTFQYKVRLKSDDKTLSDPFCVFRGL